MKDNAKALLSFMGKYFKADALIALTGIILDAMLGKTEFSTLQTFLDDINTKVSTFKSIWSKAQVGSAADKKAAAVHKAELQEAIKLLCLHLNVLANGNRELLLRTGFKVSKETRTNTVLYEPRNFRVEKTNQAGQFIVMFDRQKGTTGTSFEHTLDENPGEGSLWITETCGEDRCVLSNFTPGQKVTFRVCIVGPRKQKLYSDYITKIANYAA